MGIMNLQRKKPYETDYGSGEFEVGLPPSGLVMLSSGSAAEREPSIAAEAAASANSPFFLANFFSRF